jgi:hypothetical protein
MTQDRNAEMVENLTQDFTSRNEFYESGARLSDAMMWLNRDAGGGLMWAFDGQSTACYGRGSTASWGEGAVVDLSNYAVVTGRGGPYVTLNGVDEYLFILDAAWQESTTHNFFVWFWVYPTVITTGTVAAKWDATAGAFRSWRVYLTTANVFAFQTNNAGVPPGLALSSTLTLSASAWYYVAAYLQPSTLQAIAVGAATDASLTYTSTTTSVPAGLFDQAAALYIGALTGAAGVSGHYSGRIGVGLARANVPPTTIQSHMTRIFQATRWFYGG